MRIQLVNAMKKCYKAKRNERLLIDQVHMAVDGTFVAEGCPAKGEFRSSPLKLFKAIHFCFRLDSMKINKEDC